MPAVVSKKQKSKAETNGHVATTHQNRLGKDVDQFGRRFRPGTQVIYWTGEGRGDLRCWPATLSDQRPDGSWNVIYYQRGRPGWSYTVEFSPEPKLFSWTVMEVWDEWRDS